MMNLALLAWGPWKRLDAGPCSWLRAVSRCWCPGGRPSEARTSPRAPSWPAFRGARSFVKETYFTSGSEMARVFLTVAFFIPLQPPSIFLNQNGNDMMILPFDRPQSMIEDKKLSPKMSEWPFLG